MGPRPLRVYVKAPSDLVGHVRSAIEDWSSRLKSASGNPGAFNFVPAGSSKEADIEIRVQKGSEGLGRGRLGPCHASR